MRNESRSPCLLDFTLLCDSVLMTLPRILGKSSDVMKVLVARTPSSLFRESASGPMFILPLDNNFSVINGPYCARCIVSNDQNTANVSRYLGDGYFRLTSGLDR